MNRLRISMLATALLATVGVTQSQAQCSRGQGSQGRRASGGGAPLQFASSYSGNGLQSPQSSNIYAMRMQQLQFQQQQYAAIQRQAYRERVLEAQQQQDDLLAMRRERAERNRQARQDRIAARIAARDAERYASQPKATQLVAVHSPD